MWVEEKRVIAALVWSSAAEPSAFHTGSRDVAGLEELCAGLFGMVETSVCCLYSHVSPLMPSPIDISMSQSPYSLLGI